MRTGSMSSRRRARRGVKPTLDGLQIDPCIPAGGPGFTVRRRYRGADYAITVKNPDGVCRGVRALCVNGAPVEGNVIPPAPAGSAVTVEAVMG